MTNNDAHEESFESPAAGVHAAVADAREQIDALEEPIRRVLQAASTLGDLALAGEEGTPCRPESLMFLADSLRHEACRLHRLYHGREP